jgi:hypothetical protein
MTLASAESRGGWRRLCACGAITVARPAVQENFLRVPFAAAGEDESYPTGFLALFSVAVVRVGQ